MRAFGKAARWILLAVIAFAATGCPCIGEGIYPNYTPPAAPKGLTATVNGRIITLSWEAAEDVYSYRIYGSFALAGPFAVIGRTEGTAFHVGSMIENGTIPLEPNTEYYFKVGTYDSELSEAVSATTAP